MFVTLLATVLEEIFQLHFGRKTAGLSGGADFFTPWSFGWLPAGDHFPALGNEPLTEALGLSRFTGAIDAFDNDEKSFVHVGSK